MTTTSTAHSAAPRGETTRRGRLPRLHRRARPGHPGEQGSLRHRIRSKPGLAQLWRVGVFVAGLLFVVLGIALAVLPGPLTIPPVLVGLWIWSTEFDWARRFFLTLPPQGRGGVVARQAPPRQLRRHHRRRARLAAAAFWAVGHSAWSTGQGPRRAVASLAVPHDGR